VGGAPVIPVEGGGALTLGVGVVLALGEDVLTAGMLAVVLGLGSGEEHEATTTTAMPATDTSSGAKTILVRRRHMCTVRPRGS